MRRFPAAPGFSSMLGLVTVPFLRSSALLASLCALAACGGNDPGVTSEHPIEAPKLTKRRLSTRGSALVDEHGRRVLLRGVNVGGRSKMPPFVPFEMQTPADVPPRAEQIMNAVRKLGANGVRLTLSWEALEPRRGFYDSAYVFRYQSLLDAAYRAGLAVIIDFHQDVFQAAFCGDGFPEWALGEIPHGPPHYDCGRFAWSAPYFDPMSDVSRAFDGLWTNRDGVLDAFVGMWTYVAREFGLHPAVGAFEVMNEPGPGSQTPEIAGATILPPIYDRVAAAIEAQVGPVAVLGDEPISTQGHIGAARPPRATRASPIVRTFTTSPRPSAPPSTTIGSTPTSPPSWPAPKHGAPRSSSSEYGAPNSISQKAEFSTAVLDAADAHRASAMAWEASMSDVLWNNEDFSVLMVDGSEREWGAALDRPVARAIDGTILDLSWDSAAKRFTLSVEGNTDKVSEVYLPVRHLGATPKITVTGARFRWLPETGIVLVAAERGTIGPSLPKRAKLTSDGSSSRPGAAPSQSKTHVAHEGARYPGAARRSLAVGVAIENEVALARQTEQVLAEHAIDGLVEAHHIERCDDAALLRPTAWRSASFR